MSSLPSSLLFDRVSLTCPDGTIALDEVSGAIGVGRTGLVGRNGTGKSTLLELLVRGGEPAASVRSRSFVDRLGYLPQRLDGLDDDRSGLDLRLELREGRLREEPV
ncbi:AAA family ATPase [uncultured Microbacterium sp.]|uniref:AAA family ATPase n=1 Tax=uncultured Microbacterium sp. TaxID=191216 RepID=UPI0025FC481D|nr:AAA family ATPase [uncultured Microbacterium sp.]